MTKLPFKTETAAPLEFEVGPNIGHSAMSMIHEQGNEVWSLIPLEEQANPKCLHLFLHRERPSDAKPVPGVEILLNADGTWTALMSVNLQILE